MLRILAFVLCMLPFTASANVMTFDNLKRQPEYRYSYEEDGIRAFVPTKQSSFEDSYGRIAISDDAVGGTQYVNFEFISGSRFSVRSLDIRANINSFFCKKNGADCGSGDWSFFKFTGYRDGEAVVQKHSGPGENVSITPDFFDDFKKLDLFTIVGLSPWGEGIDPGPDALYTCRAEPCFFGELDNVRLSPVPLPAGLPLFAGALGLMMVLKRYRGRS